MITKDQKLTVEQVYVDITPNNGQYYEKTELQGMVLGSLKLFPIDGGYIIINPDAKELGLPYNGLATCWLIDEGYNDNNAQGDVLRVTSEHIDLTKIYDSVEVAKKK